MVETTGSMDPRESAELKKFYIWTERRKTETLATGADVALYRHTWTRKNYKGGGRWGHKTVSRG